MDYRAPATEGDLLDVRLTVARVGRTSFHYEYEIVDQAGRTVIEAKTVQVMYDYAAGRPVEIAQEIKDMLAVP